MKSQRKKKLLKTIKNLAIIASITAATLKLSSFFNQQNEIKVLKDKVLKDKVSILEADMKKAKYSIENHYHRLHKNTDNTTSTCIQKGRGSNPDSACYI
jgi:hypothetical protein